MSSDPVTARQHTRGSFSKQHVGRLGLVGAFLGVLAGVTQATVGSRIPEWTGAKDDPVALGVITVVLSVIAALAASRLQSSEPLSIPWSVAVVVAFVVPGVLCFTTVGRLGYPPGAMLLVACALTPVAARRRLVDASGI